MIKHSLEKTSSKHLTAHLIKLPSKLYIKLILYLRSAFCNVILNIAEVDYPENWKNSIHELTERLKSSDETLIIAGLLGLSHVIQAYEF